MDRIFAIALATSLLTASSCGGVIDRTRDPAMASQAPVQRRPEPAREREPEPMAAAATTEPPPVVDESEWAHAPVLETLEGRVSYYADSLAGHRTANGESYDPYALTCASWDLFFGTLIRVVRPDTGASVVVRVNDRGPWGRTRPRILDLSRAAAEAIDMIRSGVIDVRAEVVRRGP